MQLQRMSRDFQTLKNHIKVLASQRKEADIPMHSLNWINHLIMVKGLISIDPGLSRFCSWEELQGLIIMQECADAVSNMKTCPRCQSKTDDLYTCRKCGMRLS